MGWIELTEVLTQLGIGILVLVHVPDPFVAAQEWEHRRRLLDARFQRHTRYSECPTPVAPVAPTRVGSTLSISITILASSGRIQEDVPKEELRFACESIKPADDVTAQGPPCSTTNVL